MKTSGGYSQDIEQKNRATFYRFIFSINFNQ